MALTGDLPSEIGQQLLNLEDFILATNNQFGGNIPTKFGNLTSLGEFRLLRLWRNSVEIYSFGWSAFCFSHFLSSTAGNPIDGPILYGAKSVALSNWKCKISAILYGRTFREPFAGDELGLLPNLEQVYIQGTGIAGNLDIMFCAGQLFGGYIFRHL
jgi:hypothetical protein